MNHQKNEINFINTVFDKTQENGFELRHLHCVNKSQI